MADLFAVAGATIWIGPPMSAPSADVTEATFSAVSWTEIADWTQCGGLGDAATEITTAVISRKRDVSQKGTRNAPAQQHVFAINVDDPGQIALYAAEASNSNFPFKIVWDDEPEGGTPTINYFIGLVMSAQQAGGGANTVRALNATLKPNTNLVTVPAAA